MRFSFHASRHAHLMLVRTGTALNDTLASTIGSIKDFVSIYDRERERARACKIAAFGDFFGCFLLSVMAMVISKTSFIELFRIRKINADRNVELFVGEYGKERGSNLTCLC